MLNARCAAAEEIVTEHNHRWEWPHGTGFALNDIDL